MMSGLIFLIMAVHLIQHTFKFLVDLLALLQRQKDFYKCVGNNLNHPVDFVSTGY